ncbi:signal peptide peptidase SppA [Chitinispirillales bacterium ANBcel5]|uniref:signal peptide peptidase SppA n=1 Tax=Cellulosispirillum alkaliphilum TaxID=3039283 RepID=UPI002A593E9C|nr:signal peptide peptidase SppA [Chitinispirillales bacterium ANBcel5]
MKTITIELKGQYSEIGPQVKGIDLSATKRFRLDRFFELIELTIKNRSIKKVLIHRREGFAVPAFGGVEEIYLGLKRLKDAGKELFYYAPEYEMVDCVLGSIATQRIIHPLGQVSFFGIGFTSLFFKKLLDKHSIDVEVIRRGKYKSAADTVRCDEYDQYARKQYQTLADGVVEIMRDTVTGSSESAYTQSLLDEMLSGEKVFTASEAVKQGLVDQLRTVDDLSNEWQKEKIKKVAIKKYKGQFGSGAKIAVLVFEGMIIDGENRRHPLFGQAIGDKSMISSIRALGKNRKIKAVVFRINSGGGSAIASENILRELIALNDKKPVVISMGPVAGSGGYWISTTGRRLFALPSTVTGSIGVLSLYFNFAEVLRKHGITADSVKSGDLADFASALRPLSETEYNNIDHITGHLYEEFIERVAKARNLSIKRVDELGEGQVFLGKDADEMDLVDDLGGLYDAIDYAKELIRTKKATIVFKPKVKIPFLMKLLSAKQSGAAFYDGIKGTDTLHNSMANISQPLTPISLVKACLSLHGKTLFIDPFLQSFLEKRDTDVFNRDDS